MVQDGKNALEWARHPESLCHPHGGHAQVEDSPPPKQWQSSWVDEETHVHLARFPFAVSTKLAVKEGIARATPDEVMSGTVASESPM
ncbi:unnamed protein product [Symbiodinium sp. CCMP2592]|nr:unnamed protein product [Symbiodinium sp. CCMP2592]